MISKDQYNEWRNRPDTLFFRKFIHDYREGIIRQLTELMLNNPQVFGQEYTVARGRVLQLFELSDVPWETIESFYKEIENVDIRETDAAA